MAAVSLAAFCLGRYAAIGAASEAAGRTMAFLVTGWTSALHVLTARSRKNIVRYRWRENPRLYVSCLGMLFLLGGIAGLAALPSVGSALGMCALGAKQWLVALALTVVPTLVAEYGKLWDEVRLRTAEKTAVR